MSEHTAASSHASESSGLYELGRAVVMNDEPVHVAKKIVERLAERFGATAGLVALFDTSARDHPPVIEPHRMPEIGDGDDVSAWQALLGRVARDGAALLLDSGPAQRAHDDTAFLDGRSALCWPIELGGHGLGVVTLVRDRGGPHFTNHDLDQGAFLLEFLAVVVEKTQLELDNGRHVEALSQSVQESHSKLMQADRMASIGQLAAGVAHEINNPIGYVFSNVSALERYMGDLFSMLSLYEKAETSMAEPERAKIVARKTEVDLEFTRQDIVSLMEESKEGLTRVKKIVQDLKDFSYVGAEDEWQWSNLHHGLDSTLNIVHNELKYKARVVKEYGAIPDIECLPFQLNQVFMNLLINAAHAVEKDGIITVRTGSDGDEVWVEIADNGHGIAPEHRKRIFDPFFTTKPVGKGTGLGLSLAYGIVHKHGGRIEVQSEVGVGSRFRVVLPRRGAGEASSAAD